MHNYIIISIMSWWNVMRIAVAQTSSCSFADWTDLFPLFVVKKTILIQSGRCGGCHPSRLAIKEYWPHISSYQTQKREPRRHQVFEGPGPHWFRDPPKKSKSITLAPWHPGHGSSTTSGQSHPHISGVHWFPCRRATEIPGVFGQREAHSCLVQQQSNIIQ